MLGWLFSCGPSRVSSPAGADSLFFVLPKTVSKERRARDGDIPLDFCNRAGKEPNSLRSDKAPSFFRPLTKIQGAIKGRNGQTVWVRLLAPVFLSSPRRRGPSVVGVHASSKRRWVPAFAGTTEWRRFGF